MTDSTITVAEATGDGELHGDNLTSTCPSHQDYPDHQDYPTYQDYPDHQDYPDPSAKILAEEKSSEDPSTDHICEEHKVERDANLDVKDDDIYESVERSSPAMTSTSPTHGHSRKRSAAHLEQEEEEERSRSPSRGRKMARTGRGRRSRTSRSAQRPFRDSSSPMPRSSPSVFETTVWDDNDSLEEGEIREDLAVAEEGAEATESPEEGETAEELLIREYNLGD